MSGKTFEGQVARMGWEPGAQPRPELVDQILDYHGRGMRREIGPTLWGVACGALIGVLLKGIALEAAPWGPGTGTIGAVIAALALAGFAGTLTVAFWGAWRARTRPEILQFGSINLLTLLVVFLV